MFIFAISTVLKNTKMEYKEYLGLSEKTLSKNFYINEDSNAALTDTITDIVKLGDQLDLMKKIIYYGKDIKPKRYSGLPGFIRHTYNSIVGKKYKYATTAEQQVVLHAAIGMVTESIEILKEVSEAIQEDREFNKVNLFEESGDIEWYQAIFGREFNFDLSHIWETNINKLKARYGEKFSSEKALNRDIANETEVLTEGLNK